MNILWNELSWGQYLAWQALDKKTLRKINQLVTDIIRNGHSTGLGKPEPLKGDLSSYWNRRIDDKNRLVYRVRGENVEIVSCAYHYSDR